MECREDIPDFRDPLDAEAQALLDALNTPLDSSDDADAKLGRLQADKAAFNAFVEDYAQRVERGTFWGLSGIKTGLFSRSARYRVLEKGPYRGVFLVDIPSQTTVALIFSKAPHENLADRIPDVVARWKDPDTAGPVEAGPDGDSGKTEDR